MTRQQVVMLGITFWLMVFMSWDLLKRVIPLAVVVSATVAMSTMLYVLHVPWSPWFGLSGAALGFIGACCCGLPGGDRLALAWIGAMLGPGHVVMISFVSYLVLWGVLRTWGRSHSIIGVPFFPLVAIITAIDMALYPPPI